MMNWYEMPGALDGFEDAPSYLEKLNADTDAEVESSSVITYKKQSIPKTSCAWFKKRMYKKKMVRRFLSINPDMDYSNYYGTQCCPAIYLNFPSFEDDGFFDPKMTYIFNPYTRIFLSRRGDLRKYHGECFPSRGSYALDIKRRTYNAKVTNRRIRHHIVTEEVSNSYTYLRKCYSPYLDRVW